MAEVQNGWNWFIANSQVVTGTVVITGTTPTLSALSGYTDPDQANVSVVRNGTGDYTVSVANFGPGPNTTVLGQATATSTAATYVEARPGTYSGSTASVEFLVFTSGGSASDSGFNFQIMGY